MSEVELDISEDAPLLDADQRAEEEALLQHDEPLPSKPRFKARKWQAQSPGTIVLLIAIIKFSLACTGMMMLVPIYRLIEDALCHVYYEDDSWDLIEEMDCKVDEVQSRLAFLMGWLGLVSSITTLIVAFPFGMLADKIGRRPTALFAYSGLWFTFILSTSFLGSFKYTIREHPYWMMFGNIFQLLGGGAHVLVATLYAIAADVTDEKDRASNFLYLTLGASAGGLVGPLLAGLLMEKFGPLCPILVTTCVTPFVLMIFFFIPETLPATARAKKHSEQSSLAEIKERTVQDLSELFRSFLMIRNLNIPLILITFFIQNAKFSGATAILAQYISKHFGWKLYETSILLSPLGIVNLLVLVMLPKVSDLLTKRFGFGNFAKDLFLTRTSTLIIIAAALIEGVSRHVGLFILGLFIGTFGAADSPLARATMSHYVEPEYTSRLYALIGMAEVLGTFIGAPVLAAFFHIGLQKKGIWTGLPWFYLAFLSFVAWLALLFVRPPAKDMRKDGPTVPEADGVGMAPEDPLRPE